jgi:hypothetical protein
MAEVVKLHFGDQSVDSAESSLVKLIREILPMQQINWNWWEGHHCGFDHDNSEKNGRDFPAKNPLSPFQGTRSCFESIVLPSTKIFVHNYDFRTQL